MMRPTASIFPLVSPLTPSSLRSLSSLSAPSSAALCRRSASVAVTARQPAASATTFTTTISRSTQRLTPTNSAHSSLPQTHARSFASITTTPTTSAEFEHEMTALLDCLQELLDSPRFEAANLDINLSDGVLSVTSREGTWVLNKHSPTRQLWLSSPLSGPRKFNWHRMESRPEGAAPIVGSKDSIGEGWLGERDLSDSLKARLISEWTKTFGVEIDPEEDFAPHHF